MMPAGLIIIRRIKRMRSTIAYVIFIVVLAALAFVGFSANYESFVGSLFAAFLSIFTVFFVEMQLRPHITITPEEPPIVVSGGRKFLRVHVANRALWWPLKLVMDRRPATQVRAWVTFLTESNDPVFSRDRQMIGRWATTPEPVRPIMTSQNAAGVQETVFMLDYSITRDVVDIPSGSDEILDIVMRDPNEDGCHGWHNRIMGNPTPRPEDQFDLRTGRYHARVRVDVAGRSVIAYFRIVCDVGIGDFRLEPI
jgi:hypothetical protein